MYVRHEVVTPGIVIQRIAAGEGSVRVFLYTEALGLVTALAKSAREERSKLRAHLQVGTHGTFALVRGRDTWRITGATGTSNVLFTHAHSASGREAAARVFQAVRQFVHGAVPDQYLWESLSGFIAALGACAERGNARVLEYLAVLRLLASLGYVREDAAIMPFLAVSYEPDIVARAEAARATLVKAVNEAISASGL